MFIRVSLTPTASRRASEVHSLFLLFSWRVLRRSRLPHPRPETRGPVSRRRRRRWPFASHASSRPRPSDCVAPVRAYNILLARCRSSKLKMRHVPEYVTCTYRGGWRPGRRRRLYIYRNGVVTCCCWWQCADCVLRADATRECGWSAERSRKMHFKEFAMSDRPNERGRRNSRCKGGCHWLPISITTCICLLPASPHHIYIMTTQY